MYRNMAPNVATQPTTLNDYIKSGSRSTVTMAGKQLSLYNLPEATSSASNLTRAYLYGMNQHFVQLYLRDSSVPFKSITAAMNSSVPPTHSAASLMYLGPMQIAACLHLSDPANLDFCGYHLAEKSKTLLHIPEDAALRPAGVMHALSMLKPRAYFHSVCSSGLTCLPMISTYHVPPPSPLHFLSLSNQPNRPNLLLQLVLKLRLPLPLHPPLAKLSSVTIALTRPLAKHPPLLTPVPPISLMTLMPSRRFLVLTLYCLCPWP